MNPYNGIIFYYDRSKAIALPIYPAVGLSTQYHGSINTMKISHRHLRPWKFDFIFDKEVNGRFTEKLQIENRECDREP